jgi:hypothetical protein
MVTRPGVTGPALERRRLSEAPGAGALVLYELEVRAPSASAADDLLGTVEVGDGDDIPRLDRAPAASAGPGGSSPAPADESGTDGPAAMGA